MSIIATVFIPGGIAMASDSRLTGVTTYGDGSKDRRTLSDNSQKLFLIKNNTIGLACCGDAIIGSKSVEDFVRSFEVEMIKEEDTIIEITKKLRDYTVDKHGKGVIYHICGYYRDEQYVFNINGDEIIRPNLNVNTIASGALFD